MIITFDQLIKIAPGCKKANHKRLMDIAHWMNEWFPEFGIDTAQEIRHFIAQCAHESDSFNALEEYASGKAYEGRKDLGNIHPGDGIKFKGHGLIQTTGYSNHRRLGEVLHKPDMFIDNPEQLTQPNWAVWSACVFWNDRDLNYFANMPDDAKIPSQKLKRDLSPLEYITWRVNGGFNGINQRKLFYERAKTIIV